MPKISVLLHTHNDARHLGRLLESLRSCDEILIIDECSEDETERIAREHGATFKSAIPGVTSGAYAMDANHEWIFCVRSNEAFSTDLETELREWKQQEPDESLPCYSVPIRKENGDGWERQPPQVRLVNRKRMNWVGKMPPDQPCGATLRGELLSYKEP